MKGLCDVYGIGSMPPEYVLQLVACSYAVSDSLGTYILRPLALLLNTCVPNVGGVVGRQVTLLKLPQSKNAYSPMLVTPLGIVMLVKPLQPSNVLLLMLVTPLGMFMLAKLLQ